MKSRQINVSLGLQMTKIIVNIVTFLSVAVSASAEGRPAAWPEGEICQAVVYVYLSLDTVPAFDAAVGDEYRVKTPTGKLYQCEFADGNATLSWNSADDGPSFSRPLPFTVRDDELFVLTEFGAQGFVVRNGKITALH